MRLLPAREFPLDEAAQTRFRAEFPRAVRRRPVAQPRLQGHLARACPRPASSTTCRSSSSSTALITDYLPPDTRDRAPRERSQPAIEQFWSDTHTRYAMLRGDRANPPLPPHDLFLTTDEFFGAIKPFARVEIPARRRSSSRPPTDDSLGITSRQHAVEPSAASRRRRCRRWPSSAAPRTRCTACARSSTRFPGRALVLAEGLGRRETLHEYLTEHGLQPAPAAGYRGVRRRAPTRLMLGVGPLHAGFVLAAEHARARHRERALRAAGAHAHGARRRARARRPKACCATCRRSRSATRSCTSSTASAATSGSSP